MSVLMRRENTLIIEPGSDISKIQIINFILLPNSKKHFEGPPLYLPEGENFATEFLEEKIQAQLIDFKNKKSTNEHVAEVLNNLQISTFIGVELDNTAITIELLDMLSEDVLNKIVFLSVQNTQFINSSENLARVIAAMPNLTHLLTSFTGYDAEQFKQFILSEKFKLQLLNDFVVQEAQEIQFKERIDVQQPANNEITERDAGALSLLSELINAEPETDIQENMQSERAKLSKVAQDLTISSPPAQTKQLPKDLRDKIAQETDPLSLKRNSALLPIIYRELYQKPKAQQQKLPHKFIQFELQDVVLLRSPNLITVPIRVKINFEGLQRTGSKLNPHSRAKAAGVNHSD
ncbi:Conserved_hypothetical protein [Hexamita inflata]|uniref:Uncharacterized protein n=1 Tax=Hexamita inflata TaxID=28002 RepID=A0AA86QS09_9EUKA|nr:Conserved hypothetical protein [Hexamita inflata]